LTIHVHEADKLSLEQIGAFLNASQEIRFEGETREQIYHWIEQVLVRQEYHQQKRPARGLLRSYVAKMTGLSRAPRRILEREYRQYGKCKFERLASLSVSHLYNLRQQPRYRERRLHYIKTRPTAVAIGERRRPDPQGQPGYLRVDTVTSRRSARRKGRFSQQCLFHSNAVDEVTQWQIVSASARIREAWLEPVLEAMLRQFPFRILGFHSDNGSEFINRRVARMLQKLLIQQTQGVGFTCINRKAPANPLHARRNNESLSNRDPMPAA
jgi:hypothetical protein